MEIFLQPLLLTFFGPIFPLQVDLTLPDFSEVAILGHASSQLLHPLVSGIGYCTGAPKILPYSPWTMI